MIVESNTNNPNCYSRSDISSVLRWRGTGTRLFQSPPSLTVRATQGGVCHPTGHVVRYTPWVCPFSPFAEPSWFPHFCVLFLPPSQTSKGWESAVKAKQQKWSINLKRERSQCKTYSSGHEGHWALMELRFHQCPTTPISSGFPRSCMKIRYPAKHGKSRFLRSIHINTFNSLLVIRKLNTVRHWISRQVH